MPPSLNEITTFPEKFSWIMFNSKSVSDTLFFQIELGTFMSVTTCLLISVFSASSLKIPGHQVVKSYREKSAIEASGQIAGHRVPGRINKVNRDLLMKLAFTFIGGRVIFGKNERLCPLYILLYSVMQAFFNFL